MSDAGWVWKENNFQKCPSAACEGRGVSVRVCVCAPGGRDGASTGETFPRPFPLRRPLRPRQCRECGAPPPPLGRRGRGAWGRLWQPAEGGQGAGCTPVEAGRAARESRALPAARHWGTAQCLPGSARSAFNDFGVGTATLLAQRAKRSHLLFKDVCEISCTMQCETSRERISRGARWEHGATAAVYEV